MPAVLTVRSITKLKTVCAWKLRLFSIFWNIAKTANGSLAASEALDFELAQCPDSVRLMRMRTVYAFAKNCLAITEQVNIRSREFQRQGLSCLDSLHLALAETYQQDVFLTTDDKLRRAAVVIHPRINVANPAIWFMEVTQ